MIAFTTHYNEAIPEEMVRTLVSIERQAIQSRNPDLITPDCPQDDIDYNAAAFQEFLARNPDYTLTIAYDGEKPVGFALGAENIDDNSVHTVERIYALGGYGIGGEMLDVFISNLPNAVEQVQAKPLEGSEVFYAKQHFRRTNGQMWVRELEPVLS